MNTPNYRQYLKKYGKTPSIQNVFSKFLWVQPLKDKTKAQSVIKALNMIMFDRKPRFIKSDTGSES
jgi:hypothetical protein